MARKPGRPSKLTTTVKRRILKALRIGSSQARAAAYGGIDESQFYMWMKKGEAAKSGEYHDFYKEVKKAKEEAYQDHVANIKLASSNHWQASAWWLERRHPKEFGKNRQEGGEGQRVSEVVVKYIDQAAKATGGNDES